MMLETVALAAAVVLAVLLSIGGVSKLTRLDEFSESLVGFGVPGLLGKPVGLLICLAEIWTSALLVVLPSAVVGATAASGLFVLFGLAIAYNLALGRTPKCRCFGEMAAKPISWKSLARAFVLFAIAAALAWKADLDPAFGVLPLLASLGTGVITVLLATIVVGGVLAALSWFTLELYRQNGRLLVRIEALESAGGLLLPDPAVNLGTWAKRTGALAPQFELPNRNGTPTKLETLLADRQSIILIFVHPDCGPCIDLLRDVALWQMTPASSIKVVVISERTKEPITDRFDSLQTVLFDPQRTVFQAYQITGTPSAVVVTSNGRVETTMVGPEAIRRYVTDSGRVPRLTVPASSEPQLLHLPVGMTFPDLSLPNPDGQSISTKDFLGTATVFLFWNPRCGFCQQMVPNLLLWQQKKTGRSPTVVVVSLLPPGLDSLDAVVLLDADFRLSRACGVSGTPSAVATSRDGTILEPIAQGSQSIFELLRRLEAQGHVAQTVDAVPI